MRRWEFFNKKTHSRVVSLETYTALVEETRDLNVCRRLNELAVIVDAGQPMRTDIREGRTYTAVSVPGGIRRVPCPGFVQ